MDDETHRSMYLIGPAQLEDRKEWTDDGEIYLLVSRVELRWKSWI